MKKYKKQPVVIEAVRWDGSVSGSVGIILDWINDNGGKAQYRPSRVNKGVEPCIIIDTLEGKMSASFGDYIIRGLQGEFYPCKPDIFEFSYEAVS